MTFLNQHIEGITESIVMAKWIMFVAFALATLIRVKNRNDAAVWLIVWIFVAVVFYLLNQK